MYYIVPYVTGIIPDDGHYGETTDEENGDKVLGVGIMARYAEDLPLLLSILADDQRSLLKLEEGVRLLFCIITV